MLSILFLTGKIPLTINRYGAGSYVDRVWVKATPTEVEIEANVQPAKWSQINMLKDADITSDWIVLYTTSKLQAKQEGDEDRDGDRFIYDDLLYEVRKVKSYKMGILDHYAAMAVRVELTPDEETI